ncbi:MAG: S8 family serine peptidase [Verrucomicrobiae bacterium]|nr:S8 family serine peptidase [Verrucomicrobiae bacterium]MCP5540734.1 S8 family serine peptidase [Akkermansiaceae bacterium]
MPDSAPQPWPTLGEARDALRSGTGEGVRVAIVDSGIDTRHPALAGLALADSVTVTSDGVRLQVRDEDDGDLFGHGTAVAGIVREMAPGAAIGSFRALDGRNRSRSFVIAECVRQALARGYHIVNCSFGCRGLARYVMDYKDWVDAAYVAGVHVVAACSNAHFSVREWPAWFPSVIAVGVADCGEHDLRFQPGAMVSLAAMGERVRVPWLDGAWRLETGSSFAAPRVTGMIARLLSVFPGLRPDLAKALLCALATERE